jgi:hypothetical protein
VEDGDEIAHELDQWTMDFVRRMVIIVIHLLGLARAGYLAAPDSGPEGHYTGECSQVPKEVTVVTLCH